MSETQESLNLLVKIDRQRRRWRFIVFAMVVILGVVLIRAYGQAGLGLPSEYVAKVTISGMILDNPEMEETLTALAEDSRAKAIVAYVDSPGGTMVGGLNLFHALRKVAQTKPVVAVMGTTAASAGYLVSLAGDHIIANEATLTGSVGVFMPLVDATSLAQKIGIKADDISSGSMKVATSPLHQREGETKAHLQKLVNSLEDIFLSYVRQRRPVDPNTIEKISDGRVLIGRMALDMNLVDALGGMTEARIWLEKERKIPQNTPIIPVDLNRGRNFIEQFMGSTLPLKVQLGMAKEGAWSLYRP